MKEPTISIVTVVYNGKDEIEKTIQSVINQTYKNIEYIVVDGASTDGTSEIIKLYEDRISHWISEKDKGIYDAMNKGAAIANGEFIQFLNAGDSLYADDSIQKVVASMEDSDAVYFGRAFTYDDTTSWLYPSKKGDEIATWLSKGNFPNHQAMFFPKVFYKNNFYDLHYKITSDIDYKLRAYKSYRYVFIDEVVVKFALGGISTQNDNFQAIKQRIKENIRRNIKYKFYGKLFWTPLQLLIKYTLAKVTGDKFNKIMKVLKRYEDTDMVVKK